MKFKDSTALQRASYPVFEMKALGAEDADGSFEGYASVFNNIDAFGEKVVPGAFTQSIVDSKKSGGRTAIKMFWSHDPREPIGRWTDLAEDRKGLFAKGQLNLEVQRAKEIRSLMLDGSVDGLSIGFRVQEEEFEDGVVLLQKIQLLEISVVSLPANGKALVDDVKSAGKAKKFAEFCESLKEGRPWPVKDYEDLLREAGVPKSMATQIASVGYARAVRSESDGDTEEAVKQLRAALGSFR